MYFWVASNFINHFEPTFPRAYDKSIIPLQAVISCWLWVRKVTTDKGFIYIVPMQKESEVLLAMKLFVKEISAVEAIVTDASSTETS